ncbi:MAG: hypothetical protein M3024_08730 [Candidatus Dormibacteraeota bacterium]|nr:hypothetical protein [Candidatus Dormibacteraeota bacterium]
MKIPNLTLATKIGTAAIAAVAVVGGGLAVAAHTAGLQLNNASASTPPTVSSSPSPSPGSAKNVAAQATAKAVRVALMQAEAQVLGLTTKQLGADLKQGRTVQQLAGGKGLSEAQFSTQVAQGMKAALDQQVQSGTLSAKQEQRLLTRYGQAVPNWSRPVHTASPASPSPAPAQ